MKLILASVLLCLFTNSARSEILQDIGYRESLKAIRNKLPNATFTPLKPAWLQSDEAFYLVAGPGLPGSLRINFDDSRPFFKKILEEDPGNEKAAAWARLAAQVDDDALTVSWVRWIPSIPIPLTRYIQRYGKPACSFNEAMEPICEWSSIALLADMTDDQKLVIQVSTRFSKSEKRAAYLREFGFVPDSLK